ncbi:MAG: multicopper oxidase domain-containing protein [Chloroflexi bacterium]|nr:multicopper oxidase domain-containing protein [Chloroflexota bacterium]
MECPCASSPGTATRSGRPRSPAHTGREPGRALGRDLDCNNPGGWAFHCHVLTHAEGRQGMFGMVTALIVE